MPTSKYVLQNQIITDSCKLLEVIFLSRSESRDWLSSLATGLACFKKLWDVSYHLVVLVSICKSVVNVRLCLVLCSGVWCCKLILSFDVVMICCCCCFYLLLWTGHYCWSLCRWEKLPRKRWRIFIQFTTLRFVNALSNIFLVIRVIFTVRHFHFSLPLAPFLSLPVLVVVVVVIMIIIFFLKTWVTFNLVQSLFRGWQISMYQNSI